MKISDAAKLLELSGKITNKDIKKAYKLACIKFHPDKNPAGETMMKAINAAYQLLKNFEGDVENDEKGYSDLLNDAISKIIDLPDIIIEVCGAWIWVTGNTRPHAKALGKNGAGFFYASKKKAWYFRPAEYKSLSRGSHSLDEIRSMHGSQNIKNKYHPCIAN